MFREFAQKAVKFVEQNNTKTPDAPEIRPESSKIRWQKTRKLQMLRKFVQKALKFVEKKQQNSRVSRKSKRISVDSVDSGRPPKRYEELEEFSNKNNI